MLPEIAAEALHFLSRRDLDKACAVSKWLDAMVAECCEVYPLRPVALVHLYPRESGFDLYQRDKSGFELDLRVQNGTDLHQYQTFTSMDDAARFTGSILRHSSVDRFWMGAAYYGSMALRPEHWTTLIEAFRRCSIRHLRFERVDFSALDDDVFMIAVGCRGLQSLDVHDSTVRSGFVTDDLLRASLTKGLGRLRFSDNNSDAPHSLSEDLVLDVCFPADVAPCEIMRNVQLEGTGVTDTFLTKFIERARSSPVRPSGWLKFYDAPKQLGLSEYARFLVPGPLAWMESVYRFPPADNHVESYEVTVRERSSYMRLKFCTVRW